MQENKQDVKYYNGDFSKKYYDIIEEDTVSFGYSKEFEIIRKHIKDGDRICEIGCGEGSKIATIFKNIPTTQCYGFDVSKEGIGRAKQNHDKISFDTTYYDLANIPNDSFDVVCNFFVLEHIPDVLEFLDLLFSKLKKGGKMILWFPNYGSPLFPSPPVIYRKGILSKMGILTKRIFGYLPMVITNKVYKNVAPIENEFESDYDTVSEIYSGNLIRHLKNYYSIEILEYSTRWENLGENILFKLYSPIKSLGKSGLPIFKDLGPQCFLILKK